MEWEKQYLAEALGSAGRAVVDSGFTIAPEFEEENIHQFRVATKRLRAMLRLVAERPGAKADLPKKFRKLYRLSGAIRDAQLMIKRAAKASPEVPEYAAWLEQKKLAAQTDFRDFYDSALIVKVEKRLRKIEPKELSVADLKDFFTDHISDIEKILRKEPLEEEDLHDIRKKVKDLQHVTKAAKESWPEGLEASGISGTLENLENLTERAGDFNDRHNALLSLDAFVQETNPTEDILALKQSWEEKKAKSRGKLMEEINSFREAGANVEPLA